MTVTEPTDGDPVVVTVDPATTGAAFSRYQGEAEDRWEVYLTEPSPEMDPNELRTALNWTIR